MTGGFGRFMRRNAIALVALFFALGGASYAASTALINGAKIKPHTIAKNKLTNKAIKQLRGNRGPAGPQGAQGAQGAQGPAGPGAEWAAVQPSGTITRQSGGITVTRGTAGQYFVTFGDDVSRKLILASDGLSGDGGFRGVTIAGSCNDGFATYCTTNGVTNLANTVAVFTMATDNATETDHGFYLTAVGPVATGSGAPAHLPSGARNALTTG